MSTNKTTNLNLHSWTLDDAFKMSEFNENFNKLDQNAGQTWDELEAMPKRFAAGEYTGDEAASQTISLSFTPRVVYVVMPYSSRTPYESSGYNLSIYSGMFFQGNPLSDGNPTSAAVNVAEVVEGGFIVRNTESRNGNYNYHGYMNAGNAKYRYIALA